MAKIELKLPQMGESVAEATITSWLKEVGDTIEADEAVLEIATDKVDSEVPSEVDGVLVEKFFNVDDVAKVGDVLAIIETDGDDPQGVVETNEETEVETEIEESRGISGAQELEMQMDDLKQGLETTPDYASSERFYSPLVKNIAKQENISLDELERIQGTGKDGRVTKNDILAYLEGDGDSSKGVSVEPSNKVQKPELKSVPVAPQSAPVSVNGQDEIIEMSRMGKLIAQHMTDSVKTSAHVQSFIEVDVTNIWNWRNKVKDEFLKREGEKLTFTPIFMQAVAKTIKDFPMINISVQGD